MIFITLEIQSCKHQTENIGYASVMHSKEQQKIKALALKRYTHRQSNSATMWTETDMTSSYGH